MEVLACFSEIQEWLSFYFVVEKLLITKNSLVKIQKLMVNHESQPIKSNPGK